MTGGYKTEITGIVLDECQWSENTSDHGLVMKLSLKKKTWTFPCYLEEGLCLDSKLLGDVKGLPMLFNCLITELTQVPTQPNLSLWFTTVLIEKILPIENLWKVNVFLSICWIE